METRLAISLFYGLMTAAGLAMAWRSRSPALISCMTYMGLAWVGNTLVFYAIGPRWAPYVSPTIDVMVAAAIAFYVAWPMHSRAAWGVFWIYVLSGATVVAAFLAHRQGEVIYYGSLNVLFMARLAIVVGTAVHDLVVRASGIHRRALGIGLHRSGPRSDMGL